MQVSTQVSTEGIEIEISERLEPQRKGQAMNLEEIRKAYQQETLHLLGTYRVAAFLLSQIERQEAEIKELQSIPATGKQCPRCGRY